LDGFYFINFQGSNKHDIWVAKGVGIEPFTMAMDTEGKDRMDRAQVLIN
jgi:predicted ferric reductase